MILRKISISLSRRIDHVFVRIHSHNINNNSRNTLPRMSLNSSDSYSHLVNINQSISIKSLPYSKIKKPVKFKHRTYVINSLLQLHLELLTNQEESQIVDEIYQQQNVYRKRSYHHSLTYLLDLRITASQLTSQLNRSVNQHSYRTKQTHHANYEQR